MDGIAQALRFFSISELAAGNIGAGVYAGRVGAQAIEIYIEIVAGVKRREAFRQLQEWLTRIGSGGICGQKSLGLQAGSELFLRVASVPGLINGILGIFLPPLHRIQ